MAFSKQAWDQLKNLTASELMRALEKDGARHDSSRGSIQVYRYPDGRRFTIHYHPNKTYGPKLLRALLDDIGWNENDLKRLKLIR